MTTFTDNALPSSLLAREDGTWSSPGYRSARTRARWAQILVGIVASLYGVSAMSLLFELSLLDEIVAGSATDAEVTSYLSFAEALSALLVLTAVASGIAVFAWLSRTVEIVPPLGGGTPRRSPRQAIGWWFVPGANFVIPYQIVRDLYIRLETPKRQGGDRVVLAWWVLYLIGGAVSSVVVRVMDGAETFDALRSLAIVAVIASAGTAIAGMLLVLIIGEIESRAAARAASLGLHGPEAVWPAAIARPEPAPRPLSPPVVTDVGSTIADRLFALERRRLSGSISEDEYAAARDRILDEA